MASSDARNVFFVIKIVNRHMYKFMRDNLRWDWYTMKTSHVYCMLHQRSISFFKFLIACAKTQVTHYSIKLFRSTCVVNCFWQNNVYWCVSFFFHYELSLWFEKWCAFIRICFDFVRNGLNVLKNVSHDSK